MEISISTLFFTLFAGLASLASPCVLPVIPIIVTGTAEDHKHRPLLIVLGLSTAFIAMGVVTSISGALIAGKMLYIEKTAGILMAGFGTLMLADVNLFKRLTFLNRIQSRSRGRWSGLALGLTLGIVWIPCVGPLLSGVLALVATQGKIMSGVWLLLVYSIGFSVPILLAGYSSQFFRQKIMVIQKHPTMIRVVSGGVLIVFGIYIYFNGLFTFGW